MNDTGTAPSPPARSLLGEVMDLTGPAVVQGLVVTGVLFTDRLLLGSHGGATLGSMSIAGPTLWCVFSVFGALGAGVLAIVGRAHGAGDAVRVGRVTSSAIAVAAALGTVLMVLGLAFHEDISVLVASDGPDVAEVRDLANRYMFIVFLAAPLNLMGAIGTVALQAGGDTRTPMRLSWAAGFINLGLTWVLLFGHFGLPEMGIDGAAIGTAVAFSFQGIATTAFLYFTRGPVRLGKPSTRALPPIFKVAFPAVGERLIFHIGYFTFVVLVGRLGDTAMIAHQALIAIESLGFVGSSAFGIAAGALVAQKLGAKDPDAARAAGLLSAKLGVLCLTLFGLLFYCAAPWLVSWFTDDPAVIAIAVPCLRIAAFAQPLMAITDVFAGSLRGAGDTKTPMLVAMVGPVGVRISASFALAYWADLGLIGIWLGSTLDWVVRAAWLSAAFLRGHWRQIELPEEPSG